MDENFAFSKTSDLRKSILGRSDFFGFLDFSLCMQICYSPFHYVLSIFNKSKEHHSRNQYVGSKLPKSSKNLLVGIFFHAGHKSDLHFQKKIWQPFQKLVIFATFWLNQLYFTILGILPLPDWVFHSTLFRPKVITLCERILWP